LDSFTDKKIRATRVLPELHDSEAALAQVTDLLVLL
jgi:hypothetical protein